MSQRYRTLVWTPLLLAALSCLALDISAAPVLAEDAPSEASRKNSNSETARQWMRWIGRLNPPTIYERSHASVTTAFRDVVAPVAPSTVSVKIDGTPTVLGTVVRSDGYIVTKASEVIDSHDIPQGEIVCHLSDGRDLEAVVTGVSHEHDLAMLKVDASDLRAADWSLTDVVRVGSLLASAGQGDGPLAIGVASVDARKILRERGVLGIEIQTDPLGPRVGRVMSESAAQRAGLLAGDIVLKVNGQPVSDPNELSGAISANLPGALVRLLVQRGDEQREVSAKLDRHFPDPHEKRRAFQESLGTRLSERRGGFPQVFQHDTVLRPRDCGGPVVDLDSKVVGINIARAGRVATFAVPSLVVRSLMSDLMNGNLAPKTNSQQVATTTKSAAAETGE